MHWAPASTGPPGGTPLDTGWTVDDLTELFTNVIANMFTNYFNHYGGTDLDFPAAPNLA